MINSSLRVFFAVSLLRLACFFTELAVLLRRPPQRSSKPNTPASASDPDLITKCGTILDDFDPEDDETQEWLELLGNDEDVFKHTLEHLQRCYVIPESCGPNPKDR